MQKVELDFCESCIYGKQKAVSFQLNRRQNKGQKLELVHTDVWGPAQELSYGGKRYFVTFIDDATRKTWVYALKEKSEVFRMFRIWKTMVEKETGYQIKVLKFDNGGEYTSKEFAEYLCREGIHGLKTVPRTPQESGVAKKMNRTILECARCVRLHMGLPPYLWAATVDAAVYLINRSPSSALDGKIPRERWSGKEINYSHLKVFGCIAYALIDREDRKKLDAKSQKCVFIGYDGDEYGYRLWDYENNKVIRSHNVVFHEEKMYKDCQTETEHEKVVQPEYVELDTMPVKMFPVDQSSPKREVQDERIISEEVVQEERSDSEQTNDPEVPVLRRSTRVRKPKVIFDPSANIVLSHVLYTDSGELKTYDEAKVDTSYLQWECAMKDEMSSLLQNKTWELTKLPTGKKALLNKLVYRVKNEVDGSIRYKLY